MDADKIKHLDYVQNAINRMADNSFKIKGLTITLFSAFVGIYVKTGELQFLLATVLPIFLFWLLDAYYLQQERKFRAIYNELIGKSNNLRIRSFEMPLNKVKGVHYSFWCAMLSKTELLLYFGLIILVALYCWKLWCHSCH